MGAIVMAKRQLWLVLVVLLLVVPAAHAAEIRLSAAASLKDALDELTAQYARKKPSIKFTKNYGASGSLAKQLENGAPADIFISANPAWVDYLQQKGLLAANGVAGFTYNSLVFVGTLSTKASSMKDLLNLERIAIGSPRSVPAGEYALEAFRNSRILPQLEKKLVMGKDVRECLMYAERGEVDGAMVYRSDALQGRKTRILFVVPQNLYSRVTYPMALTLTGAGKSEARAFFGFLQGAEAKAVLSRYGFAPR